MPIQEARIQRTHLEKHCFGKTPMQTSLDSKQLALEKQLDRAFLTHDSIYVTA